MLNPRADRYSAAEIADDLGISADTLYRTRAVRETRDGLPKPYSTRPLLWDGPTYRAWRGRHHPMALRAPAANDSAPIAVPASIDEQRAFLHRAYGRG